MERERAIDYFLIKKKLYKKSRFMIKSNEFNGTYPVI